jgi:ribonuclease P protein component
VYTCSGGPQASTGRVLAARSQIAGKALAVVGREVVAILCDPRLEPPDEADLPAEEAQARSYARVPRAHADARGQAHPQASAQQAPAAAYPVGMPSRRRRLSRSGDFDRVYRQGRSHATRYLVVYAFPRPEDRGEPRLGVSVGRKLGGAVERNRVKRLLREAFWPSVGELADGYDFVVVARPDAAGLAEREGERGIEQALREVLAEAGLARADAR